MKYFFAFACFSLLFATNLSGQTCWDGENWTGDCAGTNPTLPRQATTTDASSSENAGAGNGGGTYRVVPNTPCRTQVTVVQEFTFPCGSGFGRETTLRYTCISGAAGSCANGFATSLEGCEDGELGGGSSSVVTINCN